MNDLPPIDTVYFERGFKTWCENTAESIRFRLGKTKISPLNSHDLASFLGIIVLYPSQVEGLPKETADYLTSETGDEWSALTVSFLGKTVIIVNQRHSPARQSADIMHELAHMLRSHSPVSHHSNDMGYVIRSYNKLQEDEANWLSRVLLLPRIALYSLAKAGESMEYVTANYFVSHSLLKYRFQITGLSKQFPRFIQAST